MMESADETNGAVSQSRPRAGACVPVVTHDQRSLDGFDRSLEIEDGQLRDAHAVDLPNRSSITGMLC
jgi:ABC-type lipoprotein export system ATPase subunit